MTPQSQQQHSHLTRPIHKEPPAHAPNAALMIDFDNVTMAIRSDLQTELKRLLQSEIIRGKVAVQRAYADWRRYPQYIVPLSESSIDLIFAPAHGANKKNATDIRLAIDALELVFTRPEIGTFILLSGDSDFSSLVLKLKEYGKYVIGVGIRESSSDLLIQNCDEYYSYNELAGFTKASDVEYVKRDPWELVVEAVKQMTAHNDVMRSDRLKQVMQEIDPNFDEKDAGFSRFSKFVIEAARRGLITLTRLDNGQYEIALGPQVEGAPAQPTLAAMSEATPAPPSSPSPSSDRPRARRGGRGRGRGREASESGEPEQPEASPPAAPAAPAAKSGFSFGDAFGLLKQAVGKIGADEEPAEAEESPAPPAPPAPTPTPDMEEEDDIPMPASSAPPPPYSTPSSLPGGVPMRSARFRRGSRGGARRPGAGGGLPEIPKIGVVEVDPNFRPRAEVLPAKAPAAPSSPTGASGGGPGQERSERGGRGGGRGGRGGRDRGRGENGERGERGERGGRGRRGGRGGRGRGPRRHESDSPDITNHSAHPRPEPTRSEPSPPPPPPPSPSPAAESEPPESFWSKVKRGLTGGT